MIRETCSCGATFETSGNNYATDERKAADTWRSAHKCVEPVTLTATVEEMSGPGWAEVVDRLTSISERLAAIGRKMPEPRP